jgi:hypothetical protein
LRPGETRATLGFREVRLQTYGFFDLSGDELSWPPVMPV